MKTTKTKLCSRCGKRPARAYSDLCGHCWYSINLEFTMQEEPDYRDWEWSICEECGSQLGSDGECHNTSCGASPDLGIDWE